MKRKGLGWIELLVALALMVLLLAILLPMLSRTRRHCRGPSCQNNLKQMGLVFMMYADESEEGCFPPPMSLEDGGAGFVPIPAIEALHPEYLTDLSLLECPIEALYTRLRDVKECYLPIPDDYDWKEFARSYNYYGWQVDQRNSDAPMMDAASAANALFLPAIPADLTGNERVPAQVVSLYQKIHEESETVKADKVTSIDQDSAVDKEAGTTFKRLRYQHTYRSEEFERERDVLAKVPTMWDTLALTPENLNHVPGGCNVLYMDGHAEFIKYPSERFPITEGMAVWSRFNEALLFGE